MREILFKAKRKNWKELPKEDWWVEGFYSQLPKPSLGSTIIAGGELCAEDAGDYIIKNISKQHSNFPNSYPLEVIESEIYEIDPDTICQYTGLTDKNGKKIWENDIITITLECDDYLTLSETGVVEYGYGQYELKVKTPDGQNAYSNLISKLSEAPFEIEKLGNIFDNPELLEVE